MMSDSIFKEDPFGVYFKENIIKISEIFLRWEYNFFDELPPPVQFNRFLLFFQWNFFSLNKHNGLILRIEYSTMRNKTTRGSYYRTRISHTSVFRRFLFRLTTVSYLRERIAEWQMARDNGDNNPTFLALILLDLSQTSRKRQFFFFFFFFQLTAVREASSWKIQTLGKR